MAGAVAQAFTPALVPVGTIAFLAMAAALGAGSMATFALVALRTPTDQVGSVTGEELYQLRERHGPQPDPSPLSPTQIRARRTMPSPTRGANAVRAVEGVVDVANGS
ncbi:hypothetical protein [Streptomyces sp. TRM75563]|uniref:hypothetical protein n=1 Tax=Streptomyces sp. TRM75563 TaxID=2817418 RepID=UPI001F600B51|nr:hypothetical protein [Streptomyces sp. TRM75563]MCI4042828.1 hypothetical protein [Streptomyces sp. TRM75563]